MAVVTIVVRGPRAELTASPDVVKSVSDLLSAETPGARFTAAFRLGKWDGVTRLMRGRSFPSGLVRRVVDHLAQSGAQVTVVDPGATGRAPYCAAIAGAMLRPYQVEAADIAERERRVLIECPTGGGKTELAAEVIRRLGSRTLWLTHRSDLAKQTRDRLAARLPGVRVTMVGAGSDEFGDVTVGMVQTLAARLKRRDSRVAAELEDVAVVILDEAHHGAAETWARVVEACSSARFQVGLSATAPSRDPLTDLRVEGATGPKRVVADVGELAQQGFLATPTVRLIEPPRDSYPSYEDVRQEVLPSWRRDPRPLSKLGHRLWDVTRRRGIVENASRNRAIAEVVRRHYRGDWRASGEKILVLVELREHAAALADACRRAGCEKTWCVTGDDNDREGALNRFRSLDPPSVFVATPWFREGMDVPEIDAGVVAGASMSEISVVQQFGRMLRPRPDKREVVVYFALDGRDPANPKDYLAQHTLAQLKIFRERGWSVERLGPSE